MSADRLERLLFELDGRNANNVTRTASYLELYALSREMGAELPWILMAHLVSRNGGYMMTDVSSAWERGETMFSESTLGQLFLFLERANFLIFYDAWYHVLHHLLGRSRALDPSRTTRFICACWPRYESELSGGKPTSEVERRLVEELVTNEQNFIERRVAHHERFEKARAVIGFLEQVGREGPVLFPKSDAKIRVGKFALLERRISTGMRIFEEILADPVRREEIFRWAMENPHTGSRAVYGGLAGPSVTEAWPLERVRALWGGIHEPPEHDPHW